jgi:hypothetical protein
MNNEKQDRRAFLQKLIRGGMLTGLGLLGAHWYCETATAPSVV